MAKLWTWAAAWLAAGALVAVALTPGAEAAAEWTAADLEAALEADLWLASVALEAGDREAAEAILAPWTAQNGENCDCRDYVERDCAERFGPPPAGFSWVLDLDCREEACDRFKAKCERCRLRFSLCMAGAHGPSEELACIRAWWDQGEPGSCISRAIAELRADTSMCCRLVGTSCLQCHIP